MVSRRQVLAALVCSCALYVTAPLGRAGPDTSAAASAAGATPEPRGRVYLFRGFGGQFFSRGTDQLAELIERIGFTTDVSEAVMCTSVVKDAIRDYRAAPAPIVVIGHSVGGACALGFADLLKAEDIPVSLVVTTDPARITEDVPTNVERYINIFQSNSLLGGRDVKPVPGFHGHYASYDLVKHTEIEHTNIEKLASIHEQIVAKIRLLAATRLPSETEPLPVRLVVPADAEIELWDSGMTVFARPGDTLQSLATVYHVPLWALTQLNPLADGATLVSGQPIIVPRHLAPPAAASDNAVLSRTPLRH